MSLASGSRIGPYEIVAPLGAGGMGEVFRARDTRLRRDVAIKVLPDSVAADPERLARFEREAQVLATLNHANIAHVYGLEPFAASVALVMELVEGRDLAQRLKQGSIPIDEAIAVALQLAHAIEAAHERGIIHRDLKPANIKVRDDGTVKVLDFGLAKAFEAIAAAESRTDNPLESPTIATPAAMTAQGVIMGTAAYMSPEQARGKTVDPRADIWAFGVVLYEMLTGRLAFGGGTVTDSLAAVLTREPDFDALPAQTPPPVRRVLQRCLQKDPARRLHHIADARIELEQSQAEPATGGAVALPPARARRGPLAVVALLALLAGIGGTLAWNRVARSSEVPQRYSLTIPEAGFNTVSYTAISPDGKWIAYSPNVAAAPFRLFLRPLEGFAAREVNAEQQTGFSPFFSPDSRWLAFFADRVLYRIPVAGGARERLAAAPSGTIQGAWGDDGTIVVSGGMRVGNAVRRALGRLTPSGTFEALTSPKPNESHLDPHILPGSTTVLFTIATATSASIATMPMTGGEPRVLIDDAARPRVARDHLLYRRPSTSDLMSAAFDVRTLTPAAERVRLGAVAHVVDAPAFDVSQDGTVIFSGPDDGTESAGYTAVMVNRTGGEAAIVAPIGSWAEPRIAPDGRSVMLRAIESPACILWSIDLERGTKTRVTFEGDSHNAIWRSDGQLSWGSELDTVRGIRLARVDRPSPAVALAPAEYERVPESWSPDRTRLIFTEMNPATQADLWLLNAETGAARPMATTKYREHQARFSPDGRWLAYVSDESGRDEIYLQLAEAEGRRVQVSVDGGHSPVWSPRGNELFFVARSSLMAVSVDLRRAPADVGRPHKQLDGRFVWERVGNYDITPDGQRFVFVQRSEETDPSSTLRVLVNWLALR